MGSCRGCARIIFTERGLVVRQRLARIRRNALPNVHKLEPGTALGSTRSPTGTVLGSLDYKSGIAASESSLCCARSTRELVAPASAERLARAAVGCRQWEVCARLRAAVLNALQPACILVSSAVFARRPAGRQPGCQRWLAARRNRRASARKIVPPGGRAPTPR